jgi:hypothetical protein
LTLCHAYGKKTLAFSLTCISCWGLYVFCNWWILCGSSLKFLKGGTFSYVTSLMWWRFARVSYIFCIMTTTLPLMVINFGPLMGCYKVIMENPHKINDLLQNWFNWTYCFCFEWWENVGTLGHNLSKYRVICCHSHKLFLHMYCS